MRVVTKDLMAMKVDELKEELSAREEATSGNKSWLRQRLHAAIVREYLDEGGGLERVFGLSCVRWLARCAQRAGGKTFGFLGGKSVKVTSA